MPSPSFSPSRRFPRIPIRILALAAATLNLSLLSQAQTETVIYSFPGEHGPGEPGAGLVFDAAGNLYGTTVLGGSHNFGTLYELSPISGGGWQETTIHSFTGGNDGGLPNSPLIIDGSGNLYGTTQVGGTKQQGTVFEFSPIAGGGYQETVLHSFAGEDDGAHGAGTVFELSPQTGGAWKLTTLVPFTGNEEGGVPYAGMVFDAAGNLYGTALNGGNSIDCPARNENGCGVVFELSPSIGGGWRERVIHSFKGPDGALPYGGVVLDSSGNLYGTTYEGGAGSCSPVGGSGCGVVFKLSAGHNWHEAVIHSFTGGADGAAPIGGLTLDASGNVYGTTEIGGDTTYSGCSPNGCGVVFELIPYSGPRWDEVALHDFTQSPDGAVPVGSLIFDSSGNLYGTTAAAGAFGSGTVFEITP
jgi:uncharacterized repeat protein (TIGR03803 family)